MSGGAEFRSAADSSLERGLENMLRGAIQVEPGANLLIAYEDASHGWYDKELKNRVIDYCREILGAKVDSVEVGPPANTPCAPLEKRLQAQTFDWVIFLARLGDQGRFDQDHDGPRKLMVYTRRVSQLESTFGTVPQAAMLSLKSVVDSLIAEAKMITITCPHGTHLTGEHNAQVSGSNQNADGKGENGTGKDVAVVRFPAAVSTPVSAGAFSGQVALRQGLTSTGSKVYEPPNLPIAEPVMAHVVNGRIDRFDGREEDANAVWDHYEMVANRFGIEPMIVDSWHQGLHPGTDASPDPDDDLCRWGETLFTSPQYLHFHTCGEYPPGEICWMVESPTLTLDGRDLYQDGQIRVETFEAFTPCLDRYPELRALFDKDSMI
jgi:hypothetical protein